MAKRYLLTLLLLSVLGNILLAQMLIKERRLSADGAIKEQDNQINNQLQSGRQYPFIRVVDGDTITVGFGGNIEYVRLIGIDAPEENDPGNQECYATESTAHIKKILDTGTVILHFDLSQGVRDKYNRLLAYVELPDGTDVGESMLKGGYAREYLYSEPYERADLYKQAEKNAELEMSGLWGITDCN